MVLRRRGGGGDDAGGQSDAYQMRQQMFSIGDDYWIETERGRRAFKVDGKALRIRKTLILEGPMGARSTRSRRSCVSVRDMMDIERAAATVATVKKALISPLRERFDVELAGGGWKVQGNIMDHQYDIESDQGKIAEVSKKWFRVRGHVRDPGRPERGRCARDGRRDRGGPDLPQGELRLGGGRAGC